MSLTTGNQLRAARALIGLEQQDLASAASVAVNTIRRIEAAGANPAPARLDTLKRLEDALREAGVDFIPENGGGAGVRLRKAG